MMSPNILTRYLFIRFLIAITAVFLLFLLLIFMIDFVELLRRAGKQGTVPVADLLWITLLRVPAFSEILLPFAVLMGSIGAFLILSRSSELTIIRTIGLSVWRFVLPGVFVAFFIGVFFTSFYNPIAAQTKAESERVYARVFGKNSSFLKTGGDRIWLRQDGVDGPSIIHAVASANLGSLLTGVMVILYDKKDQFLERIDATQAELKDGHWELQQVWVSRLGQKPRFYKNYFLSTYLTPTQISDSMGRVETISFWDLPRFIEISEKAGLPATGYKIQYQLLLSRPFLLAIMVLIAATCSLRTFRLGRIQMMVIIGLAIGIGFFMFAEISRQIGLSGKVAAEIATWVPLIVWSFVVMTVLLHQEDG